MDDNDDDDNLDERIERHIGAAERLASARARLQLESMNMNTLFTFLVRGAPVPVERVRLLSLRVRALFDSLPPTFWREYARRCFPHVDALPSLVRTYIGLGRIDERYGWRLTAALLLDAFYKPTFSFEPVNQEVRGQELDTGGDDDDGFDEIGGDNDAMTTCVDVLRERRMTLSATVLWQRGRQISLLRPRYGGTYVLERRLPNVMRVSFRNWHQHFERQYADIVFTPRAVTTVEADAILSDATAYVPLPPQMSQRVLLFERRSNGKLLPTYSVSGDALMESLRENWQNVFYFDERVQRNVRLHETSGVWRNRIGDVFTDESLDGQPRRLVMGFAMGAQ